MTLSWIRQAHALCDDDDDDTLPQLSPDATEIPEFDEDGRLYVFRFRNFAPKRYAIDRDRLFHYCTTHELPTARMRSLLRDRRNAANFYEDVREIQTHPDVEPIIEELLVEAPRRLPRLRRAESIIDFIESTQNSA